MPLEPRYLRPQDLRARRGAGHATGGASGDGKVIVVSGEIDIGDLSRLPEPFRPQGRSAGKLDCTLRFSTDGARIYRVDGQITFALEAVCQRCLSMFRWQGTGTVEVQVLEQAADVPVGALADDFIVLDGQPLDMLRLVEDELVLSLPMVPMHGHDCLDLNAVRADEAHSSKAQDIGPPSPFAVLAALRSASDEPETRDNTQADHKTFKN